jgi:hypothetical protein
MYDSLENILNKGLTVHVDGFFGESRRQRLATEERISIVQWAVGSLVQSGYAHGDKQKAVSPLLRIGPRSLNP